jgi:exodeoxyribonuclease V gamma subunit
VQPRDAVLAEIARGSLPPGQLAQPVIEQLWPSVDALVEVAGRHRHESRTLATNLGFDDTARLTGSVSGVHGHVLVAVSYSRLHPRHRLAGWTRLLALSAAHPEIPFECVTIGRGGGGGGDGGYGGGGSDGGGTVEIARIPQLGPTPEIRRAAATAVLADLIALRAQGLCDPLPIPCASSHAFADAARRGGDDPIAAANRLWCSRWGYTGEDREPEHLLALPPDLDMDRLGALAARIWGPLLAREVVE